MARSQCHPPWQFLDGSNDPDPKDMALVSLEEVTKLDATILALADLPEGWVAFRRDVKAVWERRRE